MGVVVGVALENPPPPPRYPKFLDSALMFQTGPTVSLCLLVFYCTDEKQVDTCQAASEVHCCFP
jgi:hypothetical protein